MLCCCCGPASAGVVGEPRNLWLKDFQSGHIIPCRTHHLQHHRKQQVLTLRRRHRLCCCLQPRLSRQDPVLDPKLPRTSHVVACRIPSSPPSHSVLPKRRQCQDQYLDGVIQDVK